MRVAATCPENRLETSSWGQPPAMRGQIVRRPRTSKPTPGYVRWLFRIYAGPRRHCIGTGRSCDTEVDDNQNISYTLKKRR